MNGCSNGCMNWCINWFECEAVIIKHLSGLGSEELFKVLSQVQLGSLSPPAGLTGSWCERVFSLVRFTHDA